jgi:uncharacterized protein (DUF1501 family)
MLTIWGKRMGRFCDGVSRREFLRVGALGGALTLADVLRPQANAATGALPSRPNKSVIMVYLLGGPSQLDTYDPKPDAPAEYRGEFRPIRTRVPGIDICELFPRQAVMMDKLAIIRSLSATAPNGHSDAEVMTGFSEAVSPRLQHPCMGSVISRVRGMSANGVPPYVSMRKMSFPTASPLPTLLFYLQSGFLGRAHQPLALTGTVENLGQGPAVGDLQLPAGVDAGRLGERRQLLADFDTMRRELDASGIASGLDAFQGRAFDIVTSGALRHALDVSREPMHVQQRYELDSRIRGHGTQLLLARRLVEAGVGFVEVALGYWDIHGPANVLGFPKMRDTLCPRLDVALSALIEDLHVRGMQDDVVIVVWGEFGRSPRINKDAGRDHWLPAMSAVIAGGGLRMGQVIGSTDARGEIPKDRPYKIAHVLSTIYHTIGIDPAMTFRDTSGRPRHLVDDRTLVRELL